MKKDWHILRDFLRPYSGLILLTTVLGVPLALIRTAPAAMIKYFFDHVIQERNVQFLYLFPWIFIGIYLVNFVVRFFHFYVLRKVVMRVNQSLKERLYRHLLGLSADYYNTQSTGSLMSRVTTDPQLVDGGVYAISTLIREPLTFLFLFSYACYLNWKMTLVTFAIFPPLAWVFAATGKNLKRYIAKGTEESAGIFGILQETFTGFKVIKSFQLENYVQSRFEKRNREYGRISMKFAAVEEASHPMVELLTAFLVSGVLFWGSQQVFQDEMTGGDLFAFFAAFMLMMNPLRLLNDVNIKMSSALAAAKRIQEVFDWKSHLTTRDQLKTLKGFTRGIELSDVHFAYPDSPERMILQGVSFHVNKGESIALVGASGAGKSSIVTLLPRIYDVTRGKILIDGTDLRDVTIDSLRSLISVVSQDVFLFNDTVRSNILCGRLDATEEQMREAARRANAHEFIERLPQGYDTLIGDRGQKLSGGERQRLSIARAFLRGAPILILDEATSSLDHAAERMVQNALDELMVGRTTIIIAHRLSTIRGVDRIYVVKEGRIVEFGNHEALLQRGGEYAKLHALSE